MISFPALFKKKMFYWIINYLTCWNIYSINCIILLGLKEHCTDLVRIGQVRAGWILYWTFTHLYRVLSVLTQYLSFYTYISNGISTFSESLCMRICSPVQHNMLYIHSVYQTVKPVNQPNKLETKYQEKFRFQHDITLLLFYVFTRH